MGYFISPKDYFGVYFQHIFLIFKNERKLMISPCCLSVHPVLSVHLSLHPLQFLLGRILRWSCCPRVPLYCCYATGRLYVCVPTSNFSFPLKSVSYQIGRIDLFRTSCYEWSGLEMWAQVSQEEQRLTSWLWEPQNLTQCGLRIRAWYQIWHVYVRSTNELANNQYRRPTNCS